MTTITPHLVARDAQRAVRWYADALGAEEVSRVPLPGGRAGHDDRDAVRGFTVMLADELPDQGIVSPPEEIAREAAKALGA